MISAALDPGSARCALVIARRSPIEILHARVYPVGHLEELPEPVVTVTKAGIAHAKTHRRVLSEGEIDRLVSDLTLAILASGAGEIAVEVGDIYIAEGASTAALRAQAREVGIAKDIASRVIDRCKQAGIRVLTTADKNGVEHAGVPRVTWLAALRRHSAAGLTPGLAPIPQKIGRGAALDPLLNRNSPLASFTLRRVPQSIESFW